MRKVMCLVVCVLLLSLVVAGPVSAAKSLDGTVMLFVGQSLAYVNDVQNRIDPANPLVIPVVKDGRTLLPARFIAESFGGVVGWEEATSKISIKLGDKEVGLTVGNNIMTVNGVAQTLDVPASVENDRTLVPMRAIVEALGKTVFWDDRGFIYVSNADNTLDKEKDKVLIDRLAYRLMRDPAEAKVVYDWSKSQKIDDFRVEGLGTVSVAADGALSIKTDNVKNASGVAVRQSNVWLKDLELPDNYEVEWSYRCEKVGNVMIIFNAQPFELKDLFDDPRTEAVYDDLAGQKKIVCYTLGFNRPGGPSVFRKLGGDVPKAWDFSVYNTPDWLERDKVTTLSSVTEPTIPAAEGANEVHYKLRYENGHVRFWINEHLVHDTTDNGQYPPHTTPLKGGKMAFRNFSGVSQDYYSSIVVRELVK